MSKILLLLYCSLLLPSVQFAQTSVTLSGLVRNEKTKQPLPYVNIIFKNKQTNVFSVGTIADESGRFSLAGIKTGNYSLQIVYAGYTAYEQVILVGSLSSFLDLGNIELKEEATVLAAVTVGTVKAKEGMSDKMDKKVFSLSNNISQSGGSVLQAMQNLPGITVHDGKVQLRGNDRVAILIDGKQTAITGFGSQTGLDNLPASAIEKIEIINNPSAIYDANGNAGIINIIYKKNKQEGFNGKIGFTGGLGSLWERRENLPNIRPQYRLTPKLNPSLSLNYRKNKLNSFVQADWLYTHTLNRNEFAERTYSDGTVINQQVKRNRATSFSTIKTGIDFTPDAANSISISVFFNREKILDKGDIPYFNKDYSQRLRLWQFLEDEVKYTAIGSLQYQHKFKQQGHLLNAGFSYTFHREDEKYFFTNILPIYTGEDAFKLLSDEYVADLNVDYIRPLKHGRIETGIKFRYRSIPTNMQFFPGLNSPIDVNAGGWANYKETIPALYGNYVYENSKVEVEAGLRLEYVKVNYDVNPNHNTYKSDGYDYTRPFPNIRFGYKLNEHNKFTVFYNRRVDRPNEVDIRIFPKYDEPELIKVGNPTLRPQFTNTLELGYKRSWSKASIYGSLYHKITHATITRIATIVPGSVLIYNIFQNAGKSTATGTEWLMQQELSKRFSANISTTIYRSVIHAFKVENKYPVPTIYTGEEESIWSGNIKLNASLKLKGNADMQLTMIWLAPDIIPQGKIGSRFSIDIGARKQIQKGKGELFANATDLFNTLRIKKVITGNGFQLKSTDYYETQVIRLGYSHKF